MKPKRSSRTTYADTLFSRYIRARDGRCLKCGSPGPLECCHIFGRRYRAVRWDPVNAIALCIPHHRDFDTDRVSWAPWLITEVGHEEYMALAQRRLVPWDKDVDRVIEWLKASLKEAS